MRRRSWIRAQSLTCCAPVPESRLHLKTEAKYRGQKEAAIWRGEEEEEGGNRWENKKNNMTALRNSTSRRKAGPHITLDSITRSKFLNTNFKRVSPDTVGPTAILQAPDIDQRAPSQEPVSSRRDLTAPTDSTTLYYRACSQCRHPIPCQYTP